MYTIICNGQEWMPKDKTFKQLQALVWKIVKAQKADATIIDHYTKAKYQANYSIKLFSEIK